MDTNFVLLVTLLFCFSVFFISAKEISEVDLPVDQTERRNQTLLETSETEEFRFNRSELSELELTRADECQCENGRCVPACDVTKTTPCEDQRLVCVCNPEFGRISENECKFCDCGEGFNCTFKKNWGNEWKANCICPDGYFHEDYYSSKCIPECSDKRPCQNGGNCISYKSYSKCRCLYGTKGFLCEEVDCGGYCPNRLEADCLFDKYHRVNYCKCKNSSRIYDQDSGICKPSQCENGNWEYDYDYNHRKMVCNCVSGYKKFNGYCKNCDCGDGADGECEFNSIGQKICKCLDGFYEREGFCRPCKCHGWSSRETKCEVNGNVKRCFCEKGYKDVLGHCEEINECETNNMCHPSTTCYNMPGSVYCQCPDGYKGTNGTTMVKPGEVCTDIDECIEKTNACWYSDKVTCTNLPGWYKCECFQGYDPSSVYDEPHRTKCVKTTKNWGPAIIVICITLILMVVSGLMHSHVKKRASRSH